LKGPADALLHMGV